MDEENEIKGGAIPSDDDGPKEEDLAGDDLLGDDILGLGDDTDAIPELEELGIAEDEF